MRPTTLSLAIVPLALAVSTAVAAPASAAAPSCAARIIVPQATGDPGSVAERIRFIQTELLADGESFGEVFSPLAQLRPCPTD